MWEALLDALLDSLKILAILVPVYIIIAYFEPSITKRARTQKLSPALGVAFGLIPQCGFSVIGADLYQKRLISLGTLLGIFIATSDEALPLLFAHPTKIVMILPLLAIKIIVGLGVGYLTDFIIIKSKKFSYINFPATEPPVADADCDCDGCIDGCHHHKGKSDSKWEQYFFHPVTHSLKIFVYILIINIFFALIIFLVGEDEIAIFLQNDKYWAPLIAVLVGLIPNCASSIILVNLYIMGGLGFGACVGGLCINAGLGFLILFKRKGSLKENLWILGILIVVSIATGYLTSLIFRFA